MADRLLIPKLANYILEEICEHLEKPFLPGEAAAFIFNNTALSCKLMLFVKDLIAVEGPFNESDAQPCGKDFKKEWLLTLAKGGDLVKEYVQTGFSNFVDDSKPSDSEKRRGYYREVDKSNLQESLVKYCRMKVWPTVFFVFIHS